MADISKIQTRQLVHDYLESYMDIARCELATRLLDYDSPDVRERLSVNRGIVDVIVTELARREDKSLFVRRELVLGEFST